jgi:flagellar biosynthetic protein FliO
MNDAFLTVAGFLLAVLGAWALWMRRGGGLEAGDAIRVVTSRPLGAKQRITLIEVDGERLLLGVTGEHVALVARLGAQPAAAAGSEVRTEA